MDLGRPLVDYGAVSIDQLRERMLQLPPEFWGADAASRKAVAKDRPGNAVFFYNDAPAGVTRQTFNEAKTGFVSVLRKQHQPLFAEIQDLIETSVQPRFPDCDVIRVQLAELPPGRTIEPHRDIGILAMIHRMHVPLVTHKRVTFIIDGKQFFLAPGNLYDLNNAVIHSVENRSNVMRVHLMIDMMPHTVARARYYDDEKEMLAACAAFVAKENLAKFLNRT